MDTRLFFTESTRPKEAYMAPLREVCFACPVRRECLTWAMRHEKFGIWAGLCVAERQSITRLTCAVCRWTMDPADLVGPRRVTSCSSCRARRRERYPQHFQKTSVAARRAMLDGEEAATG